MSYKIYKNGAWVECAGGTTPTNMVTTNTTQTITGAKTFTTTPKINTKDIATTDLVSVSNTGTSTDQVKYITINGVESKMGTEVDSTLSTTSTNPVENQAITTKLNTKADINNGTHTGTTTAENIVVSGDLTSNGDLTANNVVVNTEITVPTPTNDTDATTKTYVDTHDANTLTTAKAYTDTECAKKVTKVDTVTAKDQMYIKYANGAQGIVDIPEVSMTLTDDQTISGTKTFTSTEGVIVQNTSTGKTTNYTANQININDSTSSVAVSFPTESGKLALVSQIPTVDSAISSTSTNPVQNNVIKTYVDNNFVDKTNSQTISGLKTFTNSNGVSVYDSGTTTNLTTGNININNSTAGTTTTLTFPSTSGTLALTSQLPTAVIDTAMSDTSTNAVQNKTIKQAIDALASVATIKVVDTLPATPSINTLYYVGTETPYTIYLIDSDSVAHNLGTTSVNLIEYVKKTEVIDNLTSTDTNLPLSANQGKVLNEKFLPLSGGTMNGIIVDNAFAGILAVKPDDASELSLWGATSWANGAILQLTGKDNGNYNGAFILTARSSDTTACALRGNADGTLYWGDKQVATGDISGYLPLSGGTMTGQIDAGGYNIKNSSGITNLSGSGINLNAYHSSTSSNVSTLTMSAGDSSIEGTFTVGITGKSGSNILLQAKSDGTLKWAGNKVQTTYDSTLGGMTRASLVALITDDVAVKSFMTVQFTSAEDPKGDSNYRWIVEVKKYGSAIHMFAYGVARNVYYCNNYEGSFGSWTTLI